MGEDKTERINDPRESEIELYLKPAVGFEADLGFPLGARLMRIENEDRDGCGAKIFLLRLYKICKGII